MSEQTRCSTWSASSARHGAFPHELSGGMRQRVLIAMAVVNEPLVVVADEPVTGLDVVTQVHILRLLRELRERLGLAVLLISHDLPLIARTVDDVMVMQDGRRRQARRQRRRRAMSRPRDARDRERLGHATNVTRASCLPQARDGCCRCG